VLIRLGAQPGPAWVRNISDALADRDRSHKIMMPFWAFFLIYMLVFIGLTHFVTAVALSKDYVYESSAHIAGMPAVSYSPVAHGVIALGSRATGVIAMGGIAVGVIAVGGVAVGILSVGGLSVGVLALGAIALGWRAFGGLAVGHQAALGGLAVGKYAYAGSGAAYGVVEASGRQKEHLIR
jgi:uncharacterized sodium:solute symporter family permease YidK